MKDVFDNNQNSDETTGRRIVWNAKKVRKTVARLEDQSNEGDRNENEKQSQKERVAQMVRKNNAAQPSIAKVNSFIALNSMFKQD